MAMRVPDWCGLHDAVFAEAANPRFWIAIGWRGLGGVELLRMTAIHGLCKHFEGCDEAQKSEKSAKDDAGRCRTMQDDAGRCV